MPSHGSRLTGDRDLLAACEGIPYFGEQCIECQSGLGDGVAGVVSADKEATVGVCGGVAGVDSDTVKTDHANKQR
jgi:hypothetical protein